MPCLSGRYNPAVGPLIQLGIAPANTVTQPVVGGTAPQPPSLFAALIDSGASVTCISPAVAHALGLQPIGQAPMASANQIAPSNVYFVDLVIMFGGTGLAVEG